MFKIVGEILKLALPAVGEMILYMMIWVFDTIMIGQHSGQLGVSAVGLSSEIIYTFFNIFVAMGISISVTSIVSRSLGAKNVVKAERISNIAVKIGIILGVIFSFSFFIFAENILKVAGAGEEVIFLGTKYLKICAFGVIFNILTNVFNGVYRGCKNTKTPLYGAAIMNIVNVSLDYILIFGKFGAPELGVKGAAIATVLGIISAFIFSLSQLKKLPFKLNLKLKTQKEDLKELVFLGIPSACQEAAFSINRLINVAIIMTLGSLSFAANQITITIESISFMPGWGFAVALTTLAGHSVGEKDYLKTRNYINYTILLSVIVMGITAVIFYTFPTELISLFIKESEQEVIDLGVSCLTIAAIEQIPMSIAMALEGAMKGMGDTKTPFKVVFITNWLIRLPLVYYFLYLNRFPVTTFWKITAFQWTIEAILIFIVFELKWKKKYSKKI
ncbi:MATE family efflux transporter [Fusobacterium sp.]|uniref:MATE family efflux transporter n=1 Tax=Fusobacterium sp. TaxID=68766 RepID=UPI00261E098C|nr:MATE family efflux transporter [Fusobacterium sp.]